MSHVRTPILGQGFQSAVRSGWLPLLVLLLLQIAMRALRIPLFPGFAPLFVERSSRRLAVYAPLLAAAELFFSGVAAWELMLAVVAGLLSARRFTSPRLRFGVFITAGAVAWSVIGFCTNHFPIGAGALEGLLTAVFVRVTGSEVLAGLSARALLMALVYGSAALVARLRRWLPAALVMSTLLVGCAPAEREYFHPETSTSSGEELSIDFGAASGRTADHVVLPEEARSNEVCLGCHRAMIEPRDRPAARKSVHQIHYADGHIDRPCVFCHEAAGRPGFPGEYPREGARRRYNQRCASCHAGDAGPSYDGRYR